jgi:YebC/PmpR family DNA-binding regulatory protein
MSGHSKWSTIKRKKGANDAQRSRLWGKLLRLVEVAARDGGGGNVDANPTLATAVAKAKAASVPSDNIERAIKRGTGELAGETYEELSYEGYGPGGVAILVHCLTNNRNRAAQDVRSAFSGGGGKLAEPGAVSWMFEPKGVVLVAGGADEDEVFLVAADAGAEDVRSSEQSIEVITPPEAVRSVRDALGATGVAIESVELTQIPKTTVRLEGGDAKKVLNLIDHLEDLDDVQDVYANFDIPDEVLASTA